MAAGWTWPLVTSVLRLVFISTLTVVNWAALYRVIATKKGKSGRRQERLLVTTIIVVSLVYLTVVWAPFTFWALKHDLSDLHQNQQDLSADAKSRLSSPKFQTLEGDTRVNYLQKGREDKSAVEYIDLIPDLDIAQERKVVQDEFVVEYVDLLSNDDVESNDDEFELEYVDIRTGKPVKKSSPSRKSRSASDERKASWTVFFHTQPDSRLETQDISLPAAKKEDLSSVATHVKDGHANSLFWNSDVQDFVTSSCAYSLAFTAVIRLVILRKLGWFPDGPWALGIWSGLVVGVPGAMTLLVRTLGRTSNHFAPHQPEYTATGYFLYNIICDVHISEEYVVSVFLEWAALFTLLLIVMAVIVAVAVNTNMAADPADGYGRLDEKGNSSNSSNVEAWARDVVLLVGAVWSWPIKPLVVLILFCLYGSHWTNLVCWMAHVVVAIPVVFIPLAVFLSRSCSDKAPLGIYVIDEDPHLSEETQNPDIGKEKTKYDLDIAGKIRNAADVSDNNNLDEGHSTSDDPATSEGQVDEGRSQAKENLKFYLGKDILKHGLRSAPKKEDKKIILENEWGETSISEA